MAQITLHGDPIHTVGSLPEIGTEAPEFELTDVELADKSLEDFGSDFKVLNVFPSLDTGVCAESVRQFEKKVGQLDSAALLNISADLPFAHGRFIEDEGIERAKHLSVFRSEFPDTYGLRIEDGPMRGLCSRAVVVISPDNEVIYTEQVSEIGEEPAYSAALSSIG